MSIITVSLSKTNVFSQFSLDQPERQDSAAVAALTRKPAENGGSAVSAFHVSNFNGIVRASTHPNEFLPFAIGIMSQSSPRTCSDQALPQVLLVGAGVVGRAIANAHLEAGIPFVLADQNEDVITDASLWLAGQGNADSTPGCDLDLAMPAVRLTPRKVAGNESKTNSQSWIVIESVIEQLAVKQTVFSELRGQMGDDAIFCTNTSTLRIADIASGLEHADKLCGMHFFMPIVGRDAVEVVPHAVATDHGTARSTLAMAREHVLRLGKRPIEVVDSPGFLVNRLLSPYLNQALLLLTTGSNAHQIESAAKSFGMPLSPLELIDWIGAPTMFHAGRVFWQSFPGRLDPSPMVAGLVKRKRLGRHIGWGLYDYRGEVRSQDLSDETKELIERYRTDSRPYSDRDVELLLSVPMWIESQLALREGVIEDAPSVEKAMHGGLGYQNPLGWNGYFQTLGQQAIEDAIANWSPKFRSMGLPAEAKDA